jgi:hypothetical protein
MRNDSTVNKRLSVDPQKSGTWFEQTKDEEEERQSYENLFCTTLYDVVNN